jgi:hypothetical protein
VLQPSFMATAQVYLRPSERVPYRGTLVLSVEPGGPVSVSLLAQLPESRLKVPPSLDLGCVPTGERVLAQLPISNTGDAPVRFSWRVDAPFQVSPHVGELAPGAAAQCEVGGCSR